MNEALLPLHVTVVGGHFLPGLLALILWIVLFKVFFRRGGLGPVRWDPRRGAGEDGSGRRPRHGFGPGAAGHRPPWAQQSPEEAALATLAERLASGDITPDEYLERSSALRETRDRGE